MRVLKRLKINVWGVIAFLVMFISLPVYADQAYKDGLIAYLDGGYQLAQTHWLKSAKDGNSKSMFNLGLLHEQKKITNASAPKAREWFRLAGDSGYPSADYHLAKGLLASKSKSQSDIHEAARLMARAADGGLVLAIEYLGDKKARKKQSVDVSRNKKNVEEKKTQAKPKSDYFTEGWVLQRNPKYWTIQMLAFKEEYKVKAFIDANKLKSKAAYFKERSKNGVVYKLVYGAYKTKIQADFARQNLSKALTEHGPWLRSMKSVQSVIKVQ